MHFISICDRRWEEHIHKAIPQFYILPKSLTFDYAQNAEENFQKKLLMLAHR
jgi:hypothetical protein